ncbi:transcriptional adapter 3-B-like [Haliotis rufescens]|uniref:transcriptional adapter 3-B-like n=1 Tax=Haliotis rufescens TaxID=6454 RepID=UPI001EB07859|nr:transcriptional adapter 3-B-like [Haliotis rufescens]
MKGKGKGMQESKGDCCPLQFPDLQPVDHTKDCPKLTNVLERSEEDGVNIDEMSSIQTDLETLLAAAGKRLKLLESEIQTLVNWQDKKDKKPTPGKQQPETPTSGKRGKGGGEDKPSKKFKDSNGKGSSVTPPPPSRPKSKVAQSKNQEFDFVDSPADLPKLPKNDAVNRFWVSVEPYCAEISNEDLKLLEEILKSHEDECEYYKIPALGKHYAEKWAEEDLKEEQRDGAKINDKKRNSNSNHNNSVMSPTETATLLKKAEANNLDESPFGHLTQRLVAALIEENIMTPIDDSLADIAGGKESAEEAPAISPRMLAKQLNIVNPAHLERRIKRELEEQGLIEIDDKVEDNPDDEILAELRRKQQELKALSQRNVTITKTLYKLAKEEMARQEMRKKLSAADAEVMEAYRKIQAAKQKKKTPTKKEKDGAQKALKERDAILKALEV